VTNESARLKRQAEARGFSSVSDDGSLVVAKTAGGSSGRVEAARKAGRAASEAADRATGVRLEIRALCTSIEQKKLRLKALKDEREKTVASVVEIPLKTPLFDTKVVTSLAPIAQLSLLCAAVFYVERKRREMLRLYVEAVELATEKIEEEDEPDMTSPMSPEVFNEKFDKHVGPIPLWLTPFPISRALGGAFETKNALGHSTSGPRAKLLALLVITLVLALAYYLFASAVDTALPSLLRDDASRRPTMRIDLSFIVASVLLVFTVAWTIMVLLPWTPPGSSEPQSKRRRMLAVVVPFATLLAVPVLAAATGRGAAVRTARSWTLLPVPLRVKAKCLLDQVMVTKPRKKKRKQRVRIVTEKWATPGVFVKLVLPERQDAKRDARAGKPTRARAMNGSRPDDVRARHPAVDSTRQGREASSLDKRSVPQVRYLFAENGGAGILDLPTIVQSAEPFDMLTASQWTPETRKKRAPYLIPKRDASASFEAAALASLRDNKPEDALRYLCHGIRRLNNPKASLRLYDLAARIAVKHKPGKPGETVLEALATSLQPHSRPLEKRVDNPAKYPPDQRRRRGRRPSQGADDAYLAVQILRRLENWRSTSWKEHIVKAGPLEWGKIKLSKSLLMRLLCDPPRSSGQRVVSGYSCSCGVRSSK